MLPQPAITCSKLTIETLEQGVNYGSRFLIPMMDPVFCKATSLQCPTLLKKNSFTSVFSEVLEKFLGHIFCGIPKKISS